MQTLFPFIVQMKITWTFNPQDIVNYKRIINVPIKPATIPTNPENSYHFLLGSCITELQIIVPFDQQQYARSHHKLILAYYT